ncbi:MAG: ISL3 family transposase [Rhodothermales bacterium]
MPTRTIPFSLPGFHIDHVIQTPDQLLLKASSKAKTARCHDCATASSRIHSHYQRQPSDLPLCQHRVRLVLRVRRFRCVNPDCPKQIFAERLDALVKPYARRTERLTTALRHIGFALGGQAGARLARKLNMPASGATLLRILHRTPTQQVSAPRVVGVDDWAWRKGSVYGTILVDLERHQPIDLLPERSSQALAAWLQAHPSIEILTRDRSPEYAQGMRLGAPQALQVADRWHLLLNLHEMLKRLIEHLHERIKNLPLLPEPALLIRQPFVRSPAERRARQARRQRRQERYEQVLALRAEGVPLQRIAARVGLSRVTVHRYVHEGRQPNRLPQAAQASKLDPYLAYLDARHREGCQNARQLWREIKEQGFQGSYRQVCRWMHPRRGQGVPADGDQDRGERHKDTGESEDGAMGSSPRRLAWILTLDPDRLSESGQHWLRYLCQDGMIEKAHELAQRFVRIVTRQSADEDFQGWYQACMASEIVCFTRFASGLWTDRDAVEAATTLPWSNGRDRFIKCVTRV